MTSPQSAQDVPIRPMTMAEAKARGRRNLAIAALLALMVIVFFVVTLVHLGGNIAQRQM